MLMSTSTEHRNPSSILSKSSYRESHRQSLFFSEPVDHPEPGGAHKAWPTATAHTTATASAAPDNPTSEPHDSFAGAAESRTE